MTEANILALIDLQNGFARPDLPLKLGGQLYVPGGEKVGEPAARLIQNLSDADIILSQDWHPADHINYVTSHPGVMLWRRERLRASGVAESNMDESVLAPPFTDICMRKNARGRYVACGVVDNGKVLDVEVDRRGYIQRVKDKELPRSTTAAWLQQTLWRPHCVRGTKSSAFVPAVAAELPEALVDRSNNAETTLFADGERNNRFYVVRKGTQSDLDSHGIMTENDKIALTDAPAVFDRIVDNLKRRKVTQANIYIGGLATNFCLEFSHNDVHAYLVPALRKAGIASKVFLLEDISRGIPIAVPDKSWPDLGAAYDRMKAKGSTVTTTDDVMRGLLRPMERRAAVQKPGPNNG